MTLVSYNVIRNKKYNICSRRKHTLAHTYLFIFLYTCLCTNKTRIEKKNNFKHCFVGRHNMWICWSWWESTKNGCSVFQLSNLDDLNWFDGAVMVGLAFSYNTISSVSFLDNCGRALCNRSIIRARMTSNCLST